ncbi:uncharacterized protein LOC124913850 [Impatiens glandulifera]|uniref:uncharacterized protein LOC124913850 n=1 Tax=Impatiens glandulifera TaxID=253017 RepID=UPI001FB0FEF7|nr:uncharacterized protein LOC124913850 [Impatiens glandulifera]
MDKETSLTIHKGEVCGEDSSTTDSDNSRSSSASRLSVGKEAGLPVCRVCHCSESDKRGDIALQFLSIVPPSCDRNTGSKDVQLDNSCKKKVKPESGVVEFIGPQGEIFICKNDIEMGFDNKQGDSLIELGCSCKSDLALVHYACALKWFVGYGSTICEICACVASNIKITDFKKVIVCLKDYEVLRERTANGQPNPPIQENYNSGVDPDAVAAIRRQRLSEISSWFNPLGSNPIAATPLSVSEQPSITVTEEAGPVENHAPEFAAEVTGILLAIGLLTVTLVWLYAPRFGKKTARRGLHFLIGGLCALAVVISFRFFVLTRIKFGQARYWIIIFVFWFLLFGIWASRTHGAHPA